MSRLSWIAATAVIATFATAMAQDGKDEHGRTSPVGYTDTPVLPGQKWRVHDIDRPRPRMVEPGAKPGDPPADAIVLFNGTDLSHWRTVARKGPDKGKVVPAQWKVENGYMEVSNESGDIFSVEKFGDCQIHIEWASPQVIDGSSQWRGNSGVLIMGRYEIQVLDSYNNKTYADGQAAAIYGQWPPMVNASRGPGQWQTYDIAWEAPKFENGKLVKPAYVTVFHNGILVHHHKELVGRTPHREVGTYEAHGAEEPLALQNHDTKVRYRNIWVRRITGYDQN